MRGTLGWEFGMMNLKGLHIFDVPLSREQYPARLKRPQEHICTNCRGSSNWCIMGAFRHTGAKSEQKFRAL